MVCCLCSVVCWLHDMASSGGRSGRSGGRGRNNMDMSALRASKKAKAMKRPAAPAKVVPGKDVMETLLVSHPS